MSGDPHARHHLHLAGATIYCSCGQYRGGIREDLTGELDEPEQCSICGERGVVTIVFMSSERVDELSRWGLKMKPAPAQLHFCP